MRIVTTNPIVYENHSNAFGDKFKAFVQKQKDKKASGQPTLFDKAKGLAGNLMNKGGQQQSEPQGTSQSSSVNTAFPQLPTPEKKGLSTGAKIGIAVSGAVVLGLVIFLVSRRNK
jgi:hypothetical protein